MDGLPKARNLTNEQLLGNCPVHGSWNISYFGFCFSSRKVINEYALLLLDGGVALLQLPFFRLYFFRYVKGNDKSEILTINEHSGPPAYENDMMNK